MILDLATFVILYSSAAGGQDQGKAGQQEDRTAARSEKQAKVDRETARMRGEIKANGWGFTVGPNPALQYSLEQLGGFNPELKSD